MNKVLITGKEPPRNNLGRFTKKHSWKFYSVFVISGIFVGTYFGFPVWYENQISYVALKAPIEKVYAEALDPMGVKVAALKEDILDRLQACESAGHTEDEGIIIVDNGQLSLGTFQFYRPTIIHYFNLLYGKEITMKEAALIAFDDEKARSLASDIIWNVEGGYEEWYNCSKKTGIIPEITVLKKLYAE